MRAIKHISIAVLFILLGSALASFLNLEGVCLAAEEVAKEVVKSDYNSFFGLDSRRVIWFIAQLHLYFGAFVLGVPMFAVIVEGVAYRTSSKKFDKLAYEFTSLLSVAYATTAAIGGLLLFAFIGLYPVFFSYMAGAFKEVMWVYALMFFGETITLYLYYYGWDWLQNPPSPPLSKGGEGGFNPRIKLFFYVIGGIIVLWGITVVLGMGIGKGMRGDVNAFIAAMIIITGGGFFLLKDRKGTHVFIGILLNMFGTLIMLLANSWASFMMSPSGVNEKGIFIGTSLDALFNPLWMPVAIHRILGNLAFGGFVAGAYAAVKFIGSKTDEERAHYDWMGYISNFVGIAGLIPLPFAGYYLGREVYSNSAVMGNNMMGGDFSWTFIIQAMLVGGLFLVSCYYLWSGMQRIPGAERYEKYVKYLLALISISFAIWLTPHNLPLTGEEIGQMAGSQYHPMLKFLGLMPAKNAVINLIILSTFFSFLLYKRGNKSKMLLISQQGKAPKIALSLIGLFCIWLVGQYALYLYTLDPKVLDLPPDRAVYFKGVATILGINCLTIIIAVILTLKDRGILAQYIYVGLTGFNVTLFLGVYGFIVMEKASPFLRNIAVSQFTQLISCIILVTSIDMFLFKKAESIGDLRWGKLSVRSQFALIILCILITFNMGLMGFIRSGLRTDWHIYGVLRDTSEWAYTPSNFTMTQTVGSAAFVFLTSVAFMFWLSTIAAHKEEERHEEVVTGAAEVIIKH
jgi:cytochrome bd-type quinol oxidase subunit 1